MTNDTEARNHGIDSRNVVADGLIQFRDIMVARNGIDEARTLNNAISYLLDKPHVVGDLSTPEATRQELILIRNQLLDAAAFEWAILCSHALWWLSDGNR